MIRPRVVLALGMMIPLTALLPTAASAQRGPRVVVGAGAATTRLERTGGASALDGFVTGANGRIAYRALALEVAYAQGTLTADGSAAGSEDLVDGEAMLAVRVLPALVLRGGPHLRALVTPAGTARWTRWEMRMQLEADLVPDAMRVDAEFATALAAEVNTVDADGSAYGANVGVTLRVANSPVDLRLSYAADRASTGASSVEFLQSVGLRVSIGRR